MSEGLKLRSLLHEEFDSDFLRRVKPTVANIENRLQEALRILVKLPSVLLLEEAFYKAKDWIEQMEALAPEQSHRLYLDQLEVLLNKSKNIQLGLEPRSTKLDELVSDAKQWRERATKTFMNKNTPTGVHLLDILTRDRRELIVADCNAIGLQIFGLPSSL